MPRGRPLSHDSVAAISRDVRGRARIGEGPLHRSYPIKRPLAVAAFLTPPSPSASPLRPTPLRALGRADALRLTTSNRIVTFSTGFSVLATRNVAVTGLAGGEQLIGIDRRPRTGDVYGVGKLGSAGSLHTINPSTGAATFVAALVGAPTAASPRGGPVALSGTEFGSTSTPWPTLCGSSATPAKACG